MLIVHHLGRSQSERIVWLCEELQLSYELKTWARDKTTRLAPPEYSALHPIGAAPVIHDGDLVLAESGAVVEYILAKYGNGRLKPTADHPDFAPYLYWFHFANGTLQPAILRTMTVRRLELPSDHPVAVFTRERWTRAIDLVAQRLRETPWLAGHAFTAPDIMTVFTLTTMRSFVPFDLTPYPSILAWLARVGERPAYRTAMEKGDPGMALLLT